MLRKICVILILMGIIVGVSRHSFGGCPEGHLDISITNNGKSYCASGTIPGGKKVKVSLSWVNTNWSKRKTFCQLYTDDDGSYETSRFISAKPSWATELRLVSGGYDPCSEPFPSLILKESGEFQSTEQDCTPCPSEVPTLSQLGYVILFLLVVSFGIWMLYRKRATQCKSD